MRVNIQTLIDDAKCHEVVRQLRWPTGVQCPACSAAEIVKRGHHTHQAIANGISAGRVVASLMI